MVEFWAGSRRAALGFSVYAIPSDRIGWKGGNPDSLLLIEFVRKQSEQH